MGMSTKTDRRGFLKGLGLAGAALGAGALAPRAAGSPVSGLRLGMASYSFRAFGLDAALAMTKRLGLGRISLKSMHLPLETPAEGIRAAAAKARAMGLEPYSGGVIYMTTPAEVDQAFAYAKAAGMEMIIGVPQHDLLPRVEERAVALDIKLAIHNHGPTDKLYPSPESAYDRIKGLDRRLGVCLDVGHTQRCGLDPAVSAERCFDRLHDVHIKDVTAATAAGATLEAGRGIVDIPKLLRTLLRLGYAGTISLEYEKDEKDPLAGAAESIGYFRGVLAALGARAR
jgi:sugar phosphate isomerase/epimerase